MGYGYQDQIVEALGVIAAGPPASPAAAVSAWQTLQTSVRDWRQMGAVSSTGGVGPSVSVYEGALAERVAIDLRVYRNAMAAAELAPDPVQALAPASSGVDFSLRPVRF